ncbi:MAG: hypothetical protein DWQ10_08830 [Calditrichaeota bacterium]|nr:MAG: hypothetical protein DWQ10_08830 [Calditrichota bacterium]
MPGEPITNYDVFRVHRVDSVTKYISNTTLYDQIYIYHKTKDTVYIATDSSKRVAKDMIAPDFQPGLIPPTGPEQNSPDTKQRKSDSTRTDQTKMKLLLEDVDSPDDTSATEQ